MDAELGALAGLGPLGRAVAEQGIGEEAKLVRGFGWEAQGDTLAAKARAGEGDVVIAGREFGVDRAASSGTR